MRALRHRVEYLALVAYSRLARSLPRRVALRMGELVGELGWLLRLRSGAVLSNLERVFPHKTMAEKLRIGRASCRNFGRSATEFARFARDRADVRELVDVRGADALAEACRRPGTSDALDGGAAAGDAEANGSGAIVVTGHLGAWALYVTALAANGVPTALLVGKQSNARVDRLIHSLPGDAVAFIGKGPLAPRGVLRNLAEGRAVLMVADQHSTVGVEAPFLGHLCKTLPLPGAVLARKDRPLFLLEGYHLSGGRHRVELTEIDLKELRSAARSEGADSSSAHPRSAEAQPEDGDSPDLALAITTKCNDAIGAAVLRHPEQYFWHHRRWRRDGEDCPRH